MIQQGTWTITPIFFGSFVFLAREIQLNLAILNHQSGRGPTFLGVCSTNPLPAARGLVKMDRKKSSLDGRSQSHVWTPNRNLVIDFLTLNIGPKGTNLTKNPPKVA